MRTRRLLALLAVAALTAAFLPARSDEPAKKDDPCKTTDGKKTAACAQQEQEQAKPVAFTNDDLERLFGASTAPNVPVAKEATPDYLGAMQEQNDKAASQGQSVEVAKAKL